MGGGNFGAHAASAAAANRSADSAVGRMEVTTAHCSHGSTRGVNRHFACEFRQHCNYSRRVTDRRATDGGGRRWAMLALIFVARIGLSFEFQTMGSVADPLIGELHLTYAAIGTLIGLFMLPGLFLAIPAGLAGRHASDRILSASGLATLAVAGAIAATADGFVQLARGAPDRRRRLRAGLALLHQDGRRLVRRPRDRDRDGGTGDELAVRHRHGTGGPRLARRPRGLALAVRRRGTLLPRRLGAGLPALSSATRAGRRGRSAVDAPHAAANGR